TLVWADPVDADGRLVNDLDLTVFAPDGSVVAGNRHLGLTGPDRANNVEQVYLLQALTGCYTVQVRGTRVGSGGQPFALVMGQPLTEAAAIPGSTPTSGLYLAVNDRLVRPKPGSLPAGMPPGVHLYQGPDRQYGELRVLRVPGIDVIPAGGKSLVVPVTGEGPDGGYTLAAGVNVTVNGEPRTVWPREAKGAAGILWLNPANRQVYQVTAEYRVVEGKLRDWPAGGPTLTLIDNPEPFTVPPGVAVEGTEEILGGSPLPGPLLGTAEGQKVGPGSLLRLLVNPATREVTYIEVRRMAVGGLVEKNTPETGLIVEGIGKLELTAGCRVQRDGEEIPPDVLRPGDYIQAFIQPPEQKAIGILATGRALWGKILYISAQDRIIYFSDQYQRIHRRAVKPGATIRRWDFPGDLTTVPIGGWGWFTLGADGQIQALRLLETGPPVKVAIEKYNPQTGELVTTTDEHYRLFSLTAVNRDGLPVPAGALRQGETAEITPLTAGTPAGLCLAGVTAANRPPGPGERPELSYMAIPMGEQLIIIGQTTGTELHIYPDRGNETITVPLRPGGRFTWLTYPQPGEEGYQLVATNRNGGAVGRYVTLPQGVGSQLTDIADYPAAPVIEKFVRQGVIKGYPDDTFRPNWEITRQELAVLFARTLGWTTGSWESERRCEKMAVAAWAQNGYAGVLDRNLFYNPAEDPTGPVTQSELQIMASRLLRQAGLPTTGAAIWTNPDRYFGPEGFTPENPVTRAAAVLVLNETLKEVSQGRL
ncbi:MAG: S-layer homology domain-containing protein, partial [Heliobacteriaceae bacterium]|nr:S-layer homology domain-containing protein [Heliobacteriaceae bacterium]